MTLFVLSHPCVTPTNQAFFAEIQRKSGWSVTIAAPAQWNGEYGVRTLERWDGFEGTLVPIPVLGSGHVPLHVYRSFFLSLLRSARPDAIYVHHEPYGLATAQIYAANALSGRVPISFFTWQNIAKRYPLPVRLLERWVYRTSAFAFSGSDSATEVLRSKGYRGPVTSLPGSVDVTRYTPSPRRSAVRRALATSDQEVLIGFMGRVVEEKGFGTLAAALNQVRELPWRLAVVGDGPYTPAFTQRLRALDLLERVVFAGYVPHPEAPDYLSAFDLLVLPSETQANWREQFGRVIIEALACGTPVVGSSSGEIPHLLRRTTGGMVFEEKNPTALAGVLRALCTDRPLRTRLGTQGRGVVRRDYTDSILADRFIRTVESAVHPRSPLT
jgi:glycosyltransferase involved in cell wall biosynthesis